MKRRAIIIGGSMSGLFSAAFLRQIGWDVDVYERSRVELLGRGAGITAHPELNRSARSERRRDQGPRRRSPEAYRHRPGWPDYR
jgi:glycine/D-amino acid oxidase-like deaminating enzyme